MSGNNLNLNINIRNATFETNSSSAHTVILIDNGEYIDAHTAVMDYLSENEDRVVYDADGLPYIPVPLLNGSVYEFGRGFSINLEWYEKLAYVLASLGSKEISILFEMFNNIGIKIAGISTSLDPWYLRHILPSDRDHMKVRPFDDSILYGLYGTIDHQSMDTLESCLESMKNFPDYANKTKAELLYEIIFSRRFAIIEDSDETNTLEEYIISNILDVNGVTHILGYNRDEGVMTFITMKEYYKNLEDRYED